MCLLIGFAVHALAKSRFRFRCTNLLAIIDCGCLLKFLSVCLPVFSRENGVVLFVCLFYAEIPLRLQSQDSYGILPWHCARHRDSCTAFPDYVLWVEHVAGRQLAICAAPCASLTFVENPLVACHKNAWLDIVNPSPFTLGQRFLPYVNYLVSVTPFF